MKTGIISGLLMITFLLPVKAQDTSNCRVLVPELSGHYEGGCKNGLAQGQGMASGRNSYTGNFRKGYPHGKGTYTWANGDVYKGDFVMGKREGDGQLTRRDTTIEGIWKNDVYDGPKPLKPKIVYQYNVYNTTFVRTGEGGKLTISFWQNHMVNKIQSLDIAGSSGTITQSGNYTNLYNIEFPFTCKITYDSWNSLRTVLNNCVLEFEIKQPGEWDLRIVN
jgi:hypothetical protein